MNQAGVATKSDGNLEHHPVVEWDGTVWAVVRFAVNFNTSARTRGHANTIAQPHTVLIKRVKNIYPPVRCHDISVFFAKRRIDAAP
jgi:hypothetical protein